MYYVRDPWRRDRALPTYSTEYVFYVVFLQGRSGSIKTLLLLYMCQLVSSCVQIVLIILL